MTEYGKLIGGKLYRAPLILNKDGKQYINPPDGMYLEFGFLPMEYSDALEYKEGYHLISSWQEHEGKLVQVWNYEQDIETSALMKNISELEEKIKELTYSLNKINNETVDAI